MKLLYLHNHYYNEDKANFIQVLNMCNAFYGAGIDVSLALLDMKITTQKLKNKIYDNLNIDCKFKLIYLNNFIQKKRLGIYQSCIPVREIIKKVNPDICYFREPINLLSLIGMDVNYIVEFHNGPLHHRKWLDIIWSRIVLANSKNVSFKYLITISEALKRYWIAKGFQENKILSFHDGVNVSFYKRPLKRSEARSKLNLSFRKKIVVYSGSLYSNRGIEKILELADIFKRVEFLVLGGPTKNKLYYEELALKKNISNIKFTGRIKQKEVSTYLYAADVLLALWSKEVPTINYCSPLKIFEYMASGRIIVAHSFPTIKEVLTDGKTAILADPDSLEDLTKKMKIALSLEYPCQIAENARSLAFENYTWNIRAQNILTSLSKDNLFK